jgi:hypothetical protein
LTGPGGTRAMVPTASELDVKVVRNGFNIEAFATCRTTEIGRGCIQTMYIRANRAVEEGRYGA